MLVIFNDKLQPKNIRLKLDIFDNKPSFNIEDSKGHWMCFYPNIKDLPIIIEMLQKCLSEIDNSQKEISKLMSYMYLGQDFETIK